MAEAGLDGREYKLLLTDIIGDDDPHDIAACFWRTRMIPIIRHEIDPDFDGALKPGRAAQINFLDTDQALLAVNAFSLRMRQLEDKAKLTLKLRTPDLMISGQTDLVGKKRRIDGKFEEDVAPLPPASLRCRFSRSAEIEASSPETFGALVRLFPKLAPAFATRNVSLPDTSEVLIAGPDVEECAFEGPTLAIASGQKAKFTLTHWTIGTDESARRLCEVSFRCKFADGLMPLSAALRAHSLFATMQAQLADVAETRDLSKTMLALPRPVGSP